MWIACTGQHIFLQMFDNLVLIYKMNVHLGNLLPTFINNVLPIHNTSIQFDVQRKRFICDRNTT